MSLHWFSPQTLRAISRWQGLRRSRRIPSHRKSPGGDGLRLGPLASPQLVQFPLHHCQLVGLFLQGFLLFLHFVEQQGSEFVVANSLYGTFLAVYDQVRIYLLHLFGKQTVLKRPVRFICASTPMAVL
jgi:hypothetical protein